MLDTKTVTTTTTPSRTVIEHRIQWGNVIKGVAIVAAVVVAAVVTYGFVAGPVTAFVAQSPFLSGAAAVLETMVVSGFELLGSAASAIGGFTGDIFAGTALGNAAQVGAMTASAAPATGQIIGGGTALAVGGLAASTLAAPFSDAMHHLMAPTPVTTQAHIETSTQLHDSSGIAGQHSTEIAAKSAEMTGHAVSHGRQAPPQNWADRVPQAERRQIAQPRESHTADISESRAQQAKEVTL